MTLTRSKPSGYVPALDGIRTLALFIVIFHHMGYRFGAPVLFPGASGFDIFMVLSGYLMTGQLLREYERTGTIKFKRFWLRRELRLLPSMWMIMFGTCIAVFLWDTERLLQTLRLAAFNAAYLTNWAIALKLENMYYFAHLWSLSQQAQYYLFWPVVLLWSLKRRYIMGDILPLCLAMILALVSWIWRINLANRGIEYGRIYFSLDTHLDPLAWGSALAVWLHWKGNTWCRQRWVSWFAAVVAFGVAVYYFLPLDRTGYLCFGGTAVMCATAVVLADVHHNPYSMLRPLLSWAPLVSIGRISYSIMLWHWIIIMVLVRSSASILMLQIAAVMLSVLIGLVMFYIVEQPSQRLKERWT